MDENEQYGARVLGMRLGNVEATLMEMKVSTKEIGDCLRELVIASTRHEENRLVVAREMTKLDSLESRLRSVEAELPTLSALKKLLYTGFGITFTVVFGYMFSKV